MISCILKNNITISVTKFIFIVFFFLNLAACTEEEKPNKLTYTLEGNIIGLTGVLTIQNNHNEILQLKNNGKFIFTTPYEQNSPYDVRLLQVPDDLTCKIENGSGSVTNGNISSITISCQDVRKWFSPKLPSDHISFNGKSANSPSVSINSQGDVIIAWTQYDGANWRLYIRAKRNGIWNLPASFQDAISPAGSDAMMPQVAINDSGEILIVWLQSNGSHNQIFLSEYTNGQWHHPASLEESISPTEGAALGPQVALNNQGKAIVVWFQDARKGLYSVFISVRDNGQWDHPDSIDDFISPSEGEDASNPEVALNNKGDAYITWEQTKDNVSQIFNSEFRDGTWHHPRNIQDHISNSTVHSGAYNPKVAISDNGEAIIAWQQVVGTLSQLFVSEYHQKKWKTPYNINTSDNMMATDIQVAIDNTGHSFFTWRESVNREARLIMSEYSDGRWGKHQTLNYFPDRIPRTPFAHRPHLAMTSSGKAILAWLEADEKGEFHLLRSIYNSNKWIGPVSEQDSLGFAEWPVLTFDCGIADNGDAVIVWLQNNGRDDQVYISEFLKP